MFMFYTLFCPYPHKPCPLFNSNTYPPLIITHTVWEVFLIWCGSNASELLHLVHLIFTVTNSLRYPLNHSLSLQVSFYLTLLQMSTESWLRWTKASFGCFSIVQNKHKYNSSKRTGDGVQAGEIYRGGGGRWRKKQSGRFSTSASRSSGSGGQTNSRADLLYKAEVSERETAEWGRREGQRRWREDVHMKQRGGKGCEKQQLVWVTDLTIDQQKFPAHRKALAKSLLCTLSIKEGWRGSKVRGEIKRERWLLTARDYMTLLWVAAKWGAWPWGRHGDDVG